MDDRAGETSVGFCFLTNGMSRIKQQAVWRGGVWRCLCIREANWALGLEIGPQPPWKASHLTGPKRGFGPLPSPSCRWEAFPWLSLGLGFSFRILVNTKFCHVFWPCSPLRFLWGNGNATKLLVAIPMFHSWKRGSHLLHELLGIGPFCSSAQAQWVVFVTLGIAINGLREVIISPGMGFCF